MNIDFVFEKDIKEKGKYDGKIEEVRGLAFGSKLALINLSASQWKTYLFFGEDVLIGEIDKTITHELVHLLITREFRHVKFNNEENICLKMAEQEIDIFS